MKILMISACPTHPITAGNRSFIVNNVRLLQSLGHEVHFLYIQNISIHNDSNKGSIEQMKKFWNDKFFLSTQTVYEKIQNIIKLRLRKHFYKGFIKCDDNYPPNLHKTINKLHSQYNYDACLVNYFYLTKALEKIYIPIKGLITHDYFSYKSFLVGDKNVVNNLTPNEEAKAMQRSPHIFSLNSGETEYFRRLSPLSHVYTIYNYCSYNAQAVTGNHNILFLSGSNQYNINGLKWFLKIIFPSIINVFHDVKLIIGGSICEKMRDMKLNQHIILFGKVNDISDFYSQGDVSINPTYEGTGLKIKTFEALSYDKIILAHPHSIDGIFSKYSAPIFSSTKSDEWVDYLKKIWNGESSEITLIKERNRIYLEKMNAFILSEYAKFLF